MVALRYNKRVVNVRSDVGCHAAAERMRAEAVGSLIVVDRDGKMVGILTDRDIVVRAMAPGCELDDLLVSDLMSRDVFCVSPAASPQDVIQKMKSLGVRRMPVVENGEAVGIVSLDDLLQTLAETLGDISEAAWSKINEAQREAGFSPAVVGEAEEPRGNSARVSSPD